MENRGSYNKSLKQSFFVNIFSFSWLKRNLSLQIISFLFILLFVYAGSSKLMEHEKFRIELGKSPLLSPYASWISWTIPAAEILISIVLAIPKFRRIALYASLNLMIMFTAYLIAILKFSFYIPCTCGGVLQGMNWDTHILFNCVFIVLALIGISLEANQLKIQSKV